MNIAFLFRYLWRKKWIIIIPTLVAVLAAWLFFRSKSETYSSVAELSTGYMDANPLDNGRNFNNTVLFNNVIQTLRSNQVLDQVSYALLLHDMSSKTPFRKDVNITDTYQLFKQYPGGKEGLISDLNKRTASFEVLNFSNDKDRLIRKLEDIYGYSRDAISGFAEIRRIEGSDFIDITSTTDNPQLSAFISNTICRTFLAYYQDKHGQASASSLDTLKSIMDTKKQLLDNKLQLLQGSSDITATNELGMLGNLQSQLTQQKGNLIAAQVALDNVNKQINTAAKQGGLANNEEIIAIRSNIDNLYAKYINGGSNDPNLLDQINKLRNDLQQKLSVLGDNASGSSMSDLLKEKIDLQVKVQVAEKTIGDLQSKINILNSTAQSTASQQGVVQGIQNEIEVARQEYIKASSLYNEALNYNIFPGNNFKQTMVASPALYPNSSSKAKTIAFAGFGIFFAMIFILLFFEFMDNSIKNDTYLKENISLPLLANLKRIDMKRLPVEKIFSENGSSSGHNAGYREQIKQLRYEIENSGKKVFLVTGYQSGSGRTSLIEALAGSLSLKNKSILVIDANFHNNTLTRKYNITPSLESLELSEDPKIADREVQHAVTVLEDNNIKVIGCGSGNYTPEEALPKANLFAWLDNNTKYDYVFIDCAALSQGPDCKELLRYVQSVILLFAADQSLAEEDKNFIDFLKKENINVLGIVLNRVNAYHMNL